MLLRIVSNYLFTKLTCTFFIIIFVVVIIIVIIITIINTINMK